MNFVNLFILKKLKKNSQANQNNFMPQPVMYQSNCNPQITTAVIPEYQSCSNCCTPVYCPNAIPIMNSYFLCTKCFQSMTLQENISSLSNQISRLNQRISKKKMSSLESSISESNKNNKQNKELIDKLYDTIDESYFKLSRKYDFKTRVSSLENLILGQKIIGLIKEKNQFINYFHKNSNKVKEISTIADILRRRVNKFQVDVKGMKEITDQIIPTMKNQTLYIKKTFGILSDRIENMSTDDNGMIDVYQRLSDRVAILETELEESRPKSKDYKELRKLRHDLTMKDGEYTKFKKSMTKFNQKVNILYLIIGINTVTILGLLFHLFFIN